MLQPRYKGQTDIHEWSDAFLKESAAFFYNFVGKDFEFRYDIDEIDLFSKHIFPIFFTNRRDMQTFIALVNAKNPVLRKELCEKTGMKRTNQYKALKRLLIRDIVIVRNERNGGRGRPKSYFLLADDVQEKMRAAVLRYSKEYMCNTCQGMKDKLLDNTGKPRVMCINYLCTEDEEYIDKKAFEVCEHGLHYHLCNDCRMKFMLR